MDRTIRVLWCYEILLRLSPTTSCPSFDILQASRGCDRNEILRGGGSMFTRAASILCLVVCFPAINAAQELRGSVRGSVTDSSGSVVVGAHVTLRSVNTGVQVLKQSSENGTYLFDFVSPGTYTLSV